MNQIGPLGLNLKPTDGLRQRRAPGTRSDLATGMRVRLTGGAQGCGQLSLAGLERRAELNGCEGQLAVGVQGVA